MASPKDLNVKTTILGYASILEGKLLAAYKKEYPQIKIEEITERPTIDITSCGKRSGIGFETNSEIGSFFRADEWFIKKEQKIIRIRDKDGQIRYKYE